MRLQFLLGYPLFFVSGLEVLLGILLLRQNPHGSRVNKSVAAFSFFSAAFSLTTAFMYVLSAAGMPYNLFARLTWIGWLSVPAALQFVFYLRDESSRAARLVGILLYAFWAAVLALCLSTDLIVTNHFVLHPFENVHGPLEDPLRFVGGMLIVWLAVEIVRLRRQVTGIKRAQLNYFFSGTLIFATAGSLTAGFLQLFGGLGFDPSLASYFSFPWVVLTGYAITRYRLFDIRIVISNALSALFLFALVAWSHVLLFKALDPVVGGPTAVVLSLSIIVAIFFGTPLSRQVRALIRRSVFRNKYGYQDVLRESVKAIITILDFGELLDYIAGTIGKALGADGVALYLAGDDGRFTLRHGVGGPARMMQDHSLDRSITDLVEQGSAALVREELERILPEGSFGVQNKALQAIGAELIIPLRYKGRLQGILTVGRKGNGEPFVQSDIDLLEALAGHAAIAIENARLFEDAKRAKESLQQSEARLATMAEESIEKYLSS